MYNSYINVAAHNSLVASGNVNTRIENVYDAGCATLWFMSDSSTLNASTFGNASMPIRDDCAAVNADAICDRLHSANQTGLAAVRLLSLCVHLSRATGLTFSTATNVEICRLVANETCTNGTSLSQTGSFSDIFCDGYNQSHVMLVMLREKCVTLARFSGCGDQGSYLGIAQGLFVIATMTLYFYLNILYGQIDGDWGDIAIRRDYVKSALANQSWLGSWAQTYVRNQRARGNMIEKCHLSDVELMRDVFENYRRIVNDPLGHDVDAVKYETPFDFSWYGHRIIKVLIIYFVVLPVNLIGIMLTIGFTDCPESVAFMSSIIFFAVFFLSTVLVGLCCLGKQDILARQRGLLEAQMMCDKTVQLALLTSRLPDIDVDDVALDAAIAAVYESAAPRE